MESEHCLIATTTTSTLEKSDSKLDLSFFDKVTQEEMEDLEEYLCEILDEIFEDEIYQMSKPHFMEIISNNLKEHFQLQWVQEGICDEIDFEEICDYIDNFIEKIFDSLDSEIPKRQNLDSTPEPNSKSEKEISIITKKINDLRTIEQPAQKTTEWYEMRHNLITASNVHKLLVSESQRNSLIYEKCKPLTIEHNNYFANANNSRQWGIIYEPLSIKIYEKLYQTTVEDFGCIQHPKYKCIGASPDGINVDSTSGRFGRMIEVKNIVNREITGIPKEEHWIQMQIQMETCDLEECDFIETRFKEFDTSAEFYHFESKMENHWNTWRGVYLCFLEKNDSSTSSSGSTYIPKFEYLPLEIPIEKGAVEEWIEETCKKHVNSRTLYTTHYWYLDELSCVLVKRNRMWFQAIVPKILETWKTIVEERETGYEHRASTRRKTYANNGTSTISVHISREISEDNNEINNNTTVREIPEPLNNENTRIINF